FNSNFWLSTILISEEASVSPDQLRQALMNECIETRLLWRPMHMQPVFADAPSYLAEGYENGLSGELFRRGLCLPSSSTLTDEQIAHVAQRIIDIVK
ncbi:MAG: DegT/DnrJ/EryC1/StrS family aminotransferase, partial [Muribaculaceae bacterium]|nr:DegT/DnrJ/EryC1/StrS family aminotransferase [Muribaculaceae bacterium]